EDGIRDFHVTGVQTCTLPICLGVEIKTSCGVKSIEKFDNQWIVQTSEKELKTNNLVVASGSSPQIWKMMKAVGHTIVPPVPSLFTFNIPDKKLHQLM